MTLNLVNMEMGKTYRFDPDSQGFKNERRKAAKNFRKSLVLDLRRKKKQKIKDQNELLDDKEFENV